MMQSTQSTTDMKNRNCVWIAVLATAIFLSSWPHSLDAADSNLSKWMPRVDDYTLMWWADGFPTHVPNARWHRCIRTGSYGLVLDTEAMEIPHFGPLPRGTRYEEATAGGESALERLPSADLTLGIRVGGKLYRCTAGGKASKFSGPRLIESGRFFQRGDVTDLVFKAEDGTTFSGEARFEVAAWPDRLGLIIAARPGLRPIAPGETCFGRLGGGFGLMRNQRFRDSASRQFDPEEFTLELWAFVPANYQAGRTPPWLVCKNLHEERDGNIGITIHGGVPQARLNIGGGRENAFVAAPTSRQSIDTEAWNHLAISYDGDILRFFVNGTLAAEETVGRRGCQFPADWPLADARTTRVTDIAFADR